MTDDALVQLSFHVEKLRRFGLGEFEDGDARRHGEDLGDFLFADFGDLIGFGALPRRFLRFAGLSEFRFLVAQGRCFLKVLIVDRGFLVATHFGDLLVEFAQLRRGGHSADTQARARFVDEVDGLVREETVGDVTVGEFGGRSDRLIGDDDPVVGFVAVAQSLEDFDGFFDGGFVHFDRLETTLEGGVLFDVLAVFVIRCCADGLEFTSGKHGFEHLGGVD